MVRRGILFFIMILMVLSIVGCTNSESTTKDSNNFQSNTNSPVTTFTMFSIDVSNSYDNFESPVARKITEKTGVKLTIEFPVGDVAQKIGIMIASGEYPDLIYAKTEENAQLVEAGAYLDLTELIDQYGDNIKKLYGADINRLRYSQEDQSIYSLSASPVNQAKWEVGNGFELQHAVIKELGYPKMKTLQDFEDAIKKYIEKYPTINGQPTIGLTLCADDWRWLITIGNPAAFATGAPDDGNWYIDPTTYEASYRFTRPQEKEYYRWLNHMYHIGLLDPDSFVQKYDAYIAKIASGRVLGLIDSKWEYAEGENVLKQSGNFERTYGQYPIQLDETTVAQDFRDTGYLAGYGVGISTNCADPVLAIKFLDFMASEEGQILRNWGVEGINYSVDENGKRVVTDEEWNRRVNDAQNYIKETGVGGYVWPFPAYGAGNFDSTGNSFSMDSPETILAKYSPIEKEVLKNYGVEKWADLYPKSDQMPKSAWGAAFLINIPQETGISLTLQRCDDIMKSGIVEAIIANPDDFDAIWDRLMGELDKVGVDDMGAKFTELVKAQVAAWN